LFPDSTEGNVPLVEKNSSGGGALFNILEAQTTSFKWMEFFHETTFIPSIQRFGTIQLKQPKKNMFRVPGLDFSFFFHSFSPESASLLKHEPHPALQFGTRNMTISV